MFTNGKYKDIYGTYNCIVLEYADCGSLNDGKVFALLINYAYIFILFEYLIS